MVWAMTKFGVREWLLMLVVFTWSVIMIRRVWEGEIPRMEEWLIPPAIITAILTAFAHQRRPPDNRREGGEKDQ